MGKPNDSGDKNEKPTAKKLRDARRDGNVAKSSDLSQTVTTFTWILIVLALSGFYADRIGQLFERSWTSLPLLSPPVLAELGMFAAETVLWLVIMPLALASVAGILVEFLQVGPLLAFKKITPKGSHLHPVEGFKRMFAKDNWFETGKAIVKTLVLTTLLVVLALEYVDDALALPFNPVSHYADLTRHLAVSLGLWIVAAFGFVSVVDWLYQKHRHQKRLQMSLYDIRQEYKQTEGDPQIKGQRKQLHQQWSTQDNAKATREATALIVNPTHIAIAIAYHPDNCPVPLVSAKAQGADALRMREAAQESGVPVLRHIPLARELNFRADHDQLVPEDLFDAIAEVLTWAERVSHQASQGTPVSLYREADDDFALH